VSAGQQLWSGLPGQGLQAKDRRILQLVRERVEPARIDARLESGDVWLYLIGLWWAP